METTTEKKTGLELFASPIASKGTFLKASFGGFAGGGKTRTATELIIGFYKKMNLTKPVLIIDNEKGARFLEPIFKEAGITTLVKETTHLADVLNAIKFLKDGEIDCLFIDSLSKVWYQYCNDYKQNNRKAFMTLQDWGKILPAWQQQFSDKFVEVAGNIVFTGRGGYTYDMEENEETKKKEFTKSGVKMKVAGETPFETDLNVWMDQDQKLKDGKLTVWRTAQIMKDRTGLIDGKIFKNPTFKDFEPIVDFLISVPTGSVSGASDMTNLTPSENYDQQNRNAQRQVFLEEIKACFDEMQLGSSNDAKALKVQILNKLFYTASWTAIEGAKLELLAESTAVLKTFKTKFISTKPETAESAIDLLNTIIDEQTLTLQFEAENS